MRTQLWLSVGVLLIAPHRGAKAQARPTAPSLMGYRLGETWWRIARTLPCEADSLPPNWQVKVKHCLPNAGAVGLWFVRDTLFLISYVPGSDRPVWPVPADDTFPADMLWNRHWKQWSIARFGEPDSVSMDGDNLDRKSVV